MVDWCVCFIRATIWPLVESDEKKQGILSPYFQNHYRILELFIVHLSINLREDDYLPLEISLCHVYKANSKAPNQKKYENRTLCLDKHIGPLLFCPYL